MRVGPQHGLPHPRQQLPERGVPRHVDPQGEGVHEEADQPLHLAAAAPRGGGAHHHVLLPRPAGQEHVEGGQQHHELRRTLAPGDGPQRLRARRGEHPRDRGAPVRGRRGAGTVDRELQDGGGALQPLRPVAELRVQHLAGEPPLLPQGEVRVLHLRLGERGGPPGGERLVERGQLAEEHPHAPPVADHVVDADQEHGLALVQACQQRAEERPARQVEGARGLRRHPPQRLRLPLRGGEGGQVQHRERHRARRLDHLHGRALHLGEDGAQRLVPADDLRQGALQHRGVRSLVEAEGPGQVVDGVPRLQLVDEPEPPLGEGKGERPVAGDAAHLGRRYRVGGLRPGALHARGQPLHRGRLEQGAQGELDGERLADARDHLRPHQRVPAEREEVVARADALPLQHPGPDPRQDLLRGGAGRRPAVAGVRPVGRGEGATVRLPAGGQRERVQRHHRGGDHVLREALPDVRAQLRRGRHPALRHHVGHQAPVPGRLLPRDDHHLPHRGVRAEHGLHLAGLDAEAPHLDLRVRAPQELDRPVGQPAHPVPRAVQARAGLRREGVGEEALGRRVRAVQVPPRQAHAAHVQLAGDADRSRAPRPVQHVALGVRDGPPDGGERRPPGRVPLQRVRGDHVRLGGAVVVVERRAQRGEPAPDGLGDAQRLARGLHLAQA